MNGSASRKQVAKCASFRRSLAWRALRRAAADPLRRGLATLKNRGRVPLAFCDSPNWGDALSPVLIELLSGRKAQHLEHGFYDRYLAIGSILHTANERAEVWGSGFISEHSTVLAPPRAIHAVRGPLSRAKLLQAGIPCPEVYGDPALLLPRFFDPIVPQQYEVGILPHYVDKGHPWIEQHRANPKVRFIDVESAIADFVRAVKSCKAILSSSLHGLICADSYGIPSVWVQFSDNTFGGRFKFRDYRLSIQAAEPAPVDVRTDPPLEDVVARAQLPELRLNLRPLLLACPFLAERLRSEVASAPGGPCGLPRRLTPAAPQPAFANQSDERLMVPARRRDLPAVDCAAGLTHD